MSVSPSNPPDYLPPTPPCPLCLSLWSEAPHPTSITTYQNECQEAFQSQRLSFSVCLLSYWIEGAGVIVTVKPISCHDSSPTKRRYDASKFLMNNHVIY